MAPELARVLGVPGAVFVGLGSILGTGIFVSFGLAAGIAGPAVVTAAVLAGLLAILNGLASAELAAAHPVSGGTYEYGYRFLTPSLGFVAGWTFLCAKTASAATAALGFAGYALATFGFESFAARVAVAIAAIAVVTARVATGLERTSRANVAIVSLTLASLATLVAIGAPKLASRAAEIWGDATSPGGGAFLEATALLFVAYAGYARIATLGEEVRDPARAIPRAIVITIVVTILLYSGVIGVAIAVVGAERLAVETAQSAAPLQAVASELAVPGLVSVVAVGAVTAMVGVLLSLVLGNSRVLLAMARRGDAPRGLARIDDGSPRRAVVVAGVAIAALAAIGNVRVTWSFSAFSVLVYYATTNLAALALPVEVRRFPQVLHWSGLAACLGLAFWVQPMVWLVGLGTIAVGLIARAAFRAAGGGR